MKNVKAYGTLEWEDKITEEYNRLKSDYPNITRDDVKKIVMETYTKPYEPTKYYNIEDAINQDTISLDEAADEENVKELKREDYENNYKPTFQPGRFEVEQTLVPPYKRNDNGEIIEVNAPYTNDAIEGGFNQVDRAVYDDPVYRDTNVLKIENSIQIVNKWLCQALDRNDSKAVREACIVLKAMKR